MKLTKSDKGAFVRAVMDDVPTVDYNAQCSQMVNAWALEQLPECVRPVVEKAPEYLERRYVATPSYLDSVYTYVSNSIHNLESVAPELWQKLVNLSNLSKKQNGLRRELSEKVSASIAACSTLKQARERLPEFEKYLPVDRDGFSTANLPAVANLVVDLNAAGWPKAA